MMWAPAASRTESLRKQQLRQVSFVSEMGGDIAVAGLRRAARIVAAKNVEVRFAAGVDARASRSRAEHQPVSQRVRNGHSRGLAANVCSLSARSGPVTPSCRHATPALRKSFQQQW